MPPPQRIAEWIRKSYPKPTVDPAWLDACLTWISEELHLTDMNTQADEIIANVDSQLLNSDLHDSMLSGTGFPRNIGNLENTHLRGNILVQIQGMTEIGHSAFSLQNVRQTRIDRADLAGLAGDEEEDEGPIPKYPRSMLRFNLSDGSQSVSAIEFRRLTELELGVTPLGYKMILKDVPIRRGIAFLEPSNVELKGFMVEELEANRDADFARGLRMRLGHPELEPEDAPVNANNLRGDPPPPNPPTGAINQAVRSPLREVSVETNPRRQPRIPEIEEHEPPSRRRVPASSSSSAVISPFFSDTSHTVAQSSDLAAIRLSPVHRALLPASRLVRQTNADRDSSDFGDDIQIDDAYLQELDAAEQEAINTIQQRSQSAGHNSTGMGSAGAMTGDSEVIVIDSDSDDKENMAPVVQRRVRQRLEIFNEDDSDVIVIE